MNAQPSVIAVVTAGATPAEDDPLAAYTHGKPKALIPIGGKPMIAYVIEALAASRYIEHIIIVALDPGEATRLPAPVEHVPDAGDLLSNVEAGIQYAVTRYPSLDAVLLSSSDVPTITPPIVDAFIEECLQSDHDLYYSIVQRSVMEARFPASRRSYVHFREGDYAGGDILLIRPSLAVSNRDLWQRLSTARKSPLRQARMLGLWPLLRLVARRMSLAEAEKCACEAFAIRGRAVPFPHAEIGMDVDKPFQLAIVRSVLERSPPIPHRGNE